MMIHRMPALLCVLFAACGADQGESAQTATNEATPACRSAEVTTLVTSFGESLRQVSLLAPDSILIPSIRAVYSPLVTPALLEEWTTDPHSAPGRRVSSPWPARIEIDTIAPASAASCRVTGEIVYISSSETAVDSAGTRTPVTLLVSEAEGGWRISAYEAETTAASPDTATGTEPAGVIRAYYDAIEDGDLRRAYLLWEQEGAASGQSFDEFSSGYAETESVLVEIGEVGRVEGAAGSQYVEIPVIVTATTTSGEEQRFEGAYVLRRSMVPGAEDADWNIYTADLTRTP